jgi:hypothetical protein
MGQQFSAASVKQQAYPLAKKPQFKDAPFIHFSLKMAHFIPATFWGLPFNLGCNSRAALHARLGCSTPRRWEGEKREKRGRGFSREFKSLKLNKA